MKPLQHFVCFTIAFGLLTLSCKKDKKVDKNMLIGTWQQVSIADDRNNNKQLDADEIHEWLGPVLEFKPNFTGSRSHTYEDTDCQIVTRVIPFRWHMLNDNKDIGIVEISTNSIFYLEPVVRIHRISTSELITKNSNSYDWVIYNKM